MWIKNRKLHAIFYGIEAILGWNPYMWRWVEGHHFLNYITKFSKDLVINKGIGMSKALKKWQGYLPSNYMFYCSQVLDPPRVGKEATFMWSTCIRLWELMNGGHRLSLVTISKQCFIFYCIFILFNF